MPLILFLDDDPNRVPFLRRGEEIVYVRTPTEFVDWLQNNPIPDVISFDHDLAEDQYAGTSGYNATSTSEDGEDCARWCIDNGFIPDRVIVHSWNSSGARAIADRFRDIGHIAITVKPFNPKQPHLWYG